MTAGALLALETSTVACSVAASVDGGVAVRELHEPGAHAARIMPMIDGVLDEIGVGIGDLAGIVYGRGPGSFTGVRIAVALTQGLAAGAGVPVLGVSSLALVAQQGMDRHAGAEVLVLQDARMGEVYAGWFGADSGGLARATRPEALLAPESVAAQGCRVAVGGALERLPALRARLDDDGLVTDASIALPRAEDALRLASRAEADDWTDAASAAAVYLRQRVATPKSA